jgi:hypothetical protein
MVCGIVGILTIGFALMCATLIGSTPISGAPMLAELIPAALMRPVAMLLALNRDVRIPSTLISLRRTHSFKTMLLHEF